MILLFLRANWKVVAAIAVALAFVGYVRSLQAQVADLRRELATRVPVITQADLEVLRGDLGKVITREVGSIRETLRTLPAPPGRTIVERVVERAKPGPAGPRGSPGPPGQAGEPLIAPERQPEARREATEKIYLTFDDGHLVNCATVGLGNPNVVELLRAPSGLLSSTSPCLGRIADTFTLADVPPPTPVRSPWKGVAAYQVTGGGWGVGLGYTLASIWKVDLDAVVLASLSRQFYLGPGASFRATATISLGAAYTYGFTERTGILWTYAGVRW